MRGEAATSIRDARLSLLESAAHVVNPSDKATVKAQAAVIFLLITCSLLSHHPALIIGAKHSGSLTLIKAA